MTIAFARLLWIDALRQILSVEAACGSIGFVTAARAAIITVLCTKRG